MNLKNIDWKEIIIAIIFSIILTILLKLSNIIP